MPTPHDADQLAELPETLTDVASGETFYIEVWLKDLFHAAQGITGGLVDLLFNSDEASAVEIENSDQFGVFPGGQIKAADGLIDRLGGGTFASGVGAGGEWARLATVQYTATTDGQISFSLAEGDLHLSRFNLGNVSWDDVELGSLTLNATPADLTGNGFVDFQDLTILLANWNQSVSAAQGNLVDEGNTPVNFEDLTVLLAAWTGPGGAASPDAQQAVRQDPMNRVTTSASVETSSRAERVQRRGKPAADARNPLRRLQAAAVDRAMGESDDEVVTRRSRRDQRSRLYGR